MNNNIQKLTLFLYLYLSASLYLPVALNSILQSVIVILGTDIVRSLLTPNHTDISGGANNWPSLEVKRCSKMFSFESIYLAKLFKRKH